MCTALSKEHEVKFFHPFVLEKTLSRRLSFFDSRSDKRFSIIRVAALGPLRNRFWDYTNRAVFFLQVRMSLRWLKCNLVYTRDFSFLIFLSKIRKLIRPKIKMVYEPHNVYSYISDKVRNPKLEVECLKIPDLIIATSGGIKRDLVEMGVDERKIRVAPNGARIDRFSSNGDRDRLRRNARLSERDLVIVYSGSWVAWKGVDILIRAFARVAEKIGDCKLILVGGSEDEIADAERLIQDLNIRRERIRTVEFSSQSEVRDYLKMADIGVLPTRPTVVGRRYTSPLKAFEYMGAGLAIVASDLPSIREILDEESAVFFEPENEEDLADKMIELILNPLKREQMKIAVRQRARQFTYEERCRRVVKAIEGAV
jgi:glycosyltransferase involved in cell wall biosynthesis